MRLHFALFSFLVAGCVRLDPDHCANQEDPSAYCQDRYCSACESANHGCMDEQPGNDCNAGGPVAETSGSPTTDPTTSSSMSATMSSTSVDPTTTTDTTMTMTTTESVDSSTTEYIEPGCGNGITEKNLEENCDMDDVPAMDCSDVGFSGPGPITCYPEGHELECTYNLENCTGAAQCGNGMIQGAEQCDMENLAKQTCESLSDDYIGGTLTCTSPDDPNSPCTFNTSQCELCRAGGDECTEDGQCCTGNCVTILMANECSSI